MTESQEQDPDLTHDHHDEHDHGHERPDYDPEHVDLPSRAPPLRSTAPQSEYTTGQVLRGMAIALVGVVLVFGLPLALV